MLSHMSAAQVYRRPRGPCRYLILVSDLGKRASQERIGLKCEAELTSWAVLTENWLPGQ